MFSNKKNHHPLPDNIQKIIIGYVVLNEINNKSIPYYFTKFLVGAGVWLPCIGALISYGQPFMPKSKKALKIGGYLSWSLIGTCITPAGLGLTVPIDTAIYATNKIWDSIEKKQSENWAGFFIDWNHPPNPETRSVYRPLKD